jgi:hypothetical protein
MSSRRPDAERAGQDERDQPYEGKHRAPESKSRSLKRSVASMVLDQPATAPDPLPDTAGSDGSEGRVDQQAANDQQSASGLGLRRGALIERVPPTRRPTRERVGERGGAAGSADRGAAREYGGPPVRGMMRCHSRPGPFDMSAFRLLVLMGHPTWTGFLTGTEGHILRGIVKRYR